MKREDLQKVLDLNKKIEAKTKVIEDYKSCFNYGGTIPEISLVSNKQVHMMFKVTDEVLRSVILDTTLEHLNNDLEVLLTALEEI